MNNLYPYVTFNIFNKLSYHDLLNIKLTNKYYSQLIDKYVCQKMSNPLKLFIIQDSHKYEYHLKHPDRKIVDFINQYDRIEKRSLYSCHWCNVKTSSFNKCCAVCSAKTCLTCKKICKKCHHCYSCQPHTNCYTCNQLVCNTIKCCCGNKVCDQCYLNVDGKCFCNKCCSLCSICKTFCLNKNINESNICNNCTFDCSSCKKTFYKNNCCKYCKKILCHDCTKCDKCSSNHCADCHKICYKCNKHCNEFVDCSTCHKNTCIKCCHKCYVDKCNVYSCHDCDDFKCVKDAVYACNKHRINKLCFKCDVFCCPSCYDETNYKLVCDFCNSRFCKTCRKHDKLLLCSNCVNKLNKN